MARRAKDTQLGERIKAARVAARLTQMQLAERVGLAGETAVSHYERGTREPSSSTLKLIAQVTDTPMSVLLGMETEAGANQNEDFQGQVIAAFQDIRGQLESLRSDIQTLRAEVGALKTNLSPRSR